VFIVVKCYTKINIKCKKMKTTKKFCENCKVQVPQVKVAVVNFITKIRTLTITTYCCTKCNKLNTKEVEEPNPDYTIWD